MKPTHEGAAGVVARLSREEIAGISPGSARAIGELLERAKPLFGAACWAKRRAYEALF